MADAFELLDKYRQGSKGGAAQSAASLSTPSVKTIDAFDALATAQQEYVGKNNGGFFAGIGYLGEKIGLGAMQSIEGIWDFTAGGLAKLFGANDWAEQQFANDWMNYGHADEWFNPSKGWAVAGDVAGGIGTSMPAIGTVYIAGLITAASGGTLAPVAAGLIAGSVAGLGAAGMGTKQAYRETGELGGKEFGYGALTGITEAGVEALSAGIGVGTGQIVQKITQNMGKEAAKTVAKESVVKGLLKSFAGEAFEEGLGEFLDPYWKRLTYDPNAENATIQEIGYAALIGGLSGVIMDGTMDAVSAGWNTITNYTKGNKIVKEGSVGKVLALAQKINEFEIDAQTGFDTFKSVQDTLAKLEQSFEQTNGEIKTAQQKMLIGHLQKANTASIFTPMIARSAERIVADADMFAERINARGITDANGNHLTVTADELRSGIDLASARKYRKTFIDAMKSNDVLRTAAVLDTAGKLLMSSDSVYDMLLNTGRTEGMLQEDYHVFQRDGGVQEKASVKEMFGIDVDNTAFEDFVAAIDKVDRRTFLEKSSALQFSSAANSAIKLATESKAEAPLLKAGITFAEGTSVYKTNGGEYVAVAKKGDAHYLFADGRISKAMTYDELQSVIQSADAETETKRAQNAKKAEQNAKKQAEAKKKTEQPKPVEKKPAEVKTEPKKEPKSTPKEVETAPKADKKTEAPKDTSADKKASEAPKTAEKTKKTKPHSTEKARAAVAKLTTDKKVRAIMQGVAVKDGKQYISDGYFFARFDDIQVGLPEIADASNYPFNALDTILEQASHFDEKNKVVIDADEIRSLVPKSKAEYFFSLVQAGDSYYQIHYVSKIMDSLADVEVYLTKTQSAPNTMYFKGSNGEAMLLPIKVQGGQKQALYKAEYSGDITSKSTSQKPQTKRKTAKRATKSTAERVEVEKMLNSEVTSQRVIGELIELGTIEYADIIIEDGDTLPRVVEFAASESDYVRQRVFSAEAFAKAVNEYKAEIEADTSRNFSNELKVKVWDKAFEFDGKELPAWYKDQYHKETVTKPEKTAPKAEQAPKQAKTTQKTKTEDFGEKIGGARKDIWQKRGLIASDLTEMNSRELKKHVKKENVWKRPDFVKAVAEGGDRGLLYAQNELFKALNATPHLKSSVTAYTNSAAFQEKLTQYVTEVGEIKKIAESIKKPEDFGKIKDWLLEQGYITQTAGNMARFQWTGKYYDSPALYGSKLYETASYLQKHFDSLGDTALLEGFGVDKADKLPNGYNIRKYNSFWDGRGDRYVVIKGGVKSGVTVSPQFSTYAEAIAWGKEKFGTAETATALADGKKKRYVPEQLKDVHRTGADYRSGKNATGDMFISEFGIKGGEFGNWMTEIDRNTSLNYGYDAFCDLADALGMEHTDIALDGTLSIGFGSRGQGLSGAAAHYEPDRKVINLTKMNGAGSLAHEWWHAFEDYITGDTNQSKMTSKLSKLPEKTRAAANELLNAINFKDVVVGTEEINADRLKTLERRQRSLEYLIKQYSAAFSADLTAEQREQYAQRNRYKRTPTEADIAKFNEIIDRARKGVKDTWMDMHAGKRTIVDELNELLKDVRGRGIDKDTRFNFASAIDSIATYGSEVNEAQTRRRRTKFYQDAVALSRTYAKDGGYWESNCEMLARAFAAYIDGKTNSSNDYLTGHALGAVPVIRDGKIDTAYIYPQDADEARAIYAAFDKLFAAAKQDGLLHDSTKAKPTATVQYALSERTELNAVPNGSKGQELGALQMKRADTVAQNEVKGYKELTAAEKLEVQWSLASAWRSGKSNAEAIQLAQLSTAMRTGIGFAKLTAVGKDGKAMSVDGACYTSGGHLTIYLNPEASRSVETATLHELAHAMEGFDGYAEIRQMALDYYKAHADEKAKIEASYKSLYEAENLANADAVLESELTAHYVENMLSKRDVLAKLTQEKPKFMQRCIEKIKDIASKFKKAGADVEATQLAQLERKFASTFNLNKGRIASRTVVKSNGRYALPVGGRIIDARTITESDVRTLLENAKQQIYKDGSYIPVRINTPQVLIESAQKIGASVENQPIILEVGKARQMMSTQEAWAASGKTGSAHNFSTNDIIALVKAMDTPQQIIYQSANNRYVEVVSFVTESGQQAMTVLEVGESRKAEYLNGYNGGFYQILVTAFQPQAKYLETLVNKKENIVIYDATKKGTSQSGSDSKVSSHLNDSPFASSIADVSTDVNPQTKKSFALSATDSQGNTLTAQQQEYFADSKVVDKDGKLLVVYHGTASSGPIGEMFKGGMSNGFLWATSFKPEAEAYSRQKRYNSQTGKGQVVPLYADIKNPKYVDAGKATPWSPEEFIDIKTDGNNDGYIISYDLPHYWSYFDKPIVSQSSDYYGLPVGTNLKQVYDANNGKMIVVAVRGSSQFKRVDTAKPTAVKDIRYALSETHDKVTTTIEQSYKPKFKETLSDGITAAQIAFTNEQAGIEKVGRRLGIKDIEAQVQAARAANHQAEEMIAGGQFRIGGKVKEYQGEGLEKIMRPIKQRGETVTADFFDYLFNKHNVSRMSLESGSIAQNEGRKAKIKSNIAKISNLTKQTAEIREKISKIANTESGKAQKADYRKQIADLMAQAKELRKENAKLQQQVDTFVPAKNKPVFDVSAERSAEIAASYEQEYPEFVETAEKLWKFLQNLNQYRVDTGLLSQEMADYLQEIYPYYVPTYRVSSNKGIGGLKGKYNLAINSTIKTAKGGTEALLPPDVIIARQVMETVRAGRINQLANSLYSAAEATGDFSYIEIVSKEKVDADTMADLDLTEIRPKNNEITFFRDGEKVTMRVSKEVFKGFDAFSPSTEVSNSLVNAAKKVNDTFKRLVTSLNPAFLVRNSIRDLQDAGINTKYGKTFMKNYARAAKEIRTNGQMWQLYRAMGGFSSSIFDFEKGFTGRQNKHGLTQAEGRLLGKGLQTMENANAFIEQLPRLAEFISSIEAGSTAEQAILDSADVTTNFGRTGSITKKLNSTLIPFLNPAIQGCSKMIRNITSARSAKAIASLILKCVLVGVLPQVINQLMYGDDEDYKELRATDKENNFLFKVGDVFVKIPKGRVASVFAGLVNRTTESLGGRSDAWDGYFSNVIQQVTPVENMSRTIFSPFADVKNNLTWYGTAIEGRQFESVAPKDRYDESTSSIAIALGKLLNYSPKKIHYLLDQYSGVIGDFVLPATTSKAEKGFLSGNFTLDPVSSNRLSNDFYKLYDEARYAKTAGDEIAGYKLAYLNKVKSAVSAMYDEISAIQKSDIADKDKIAQTKTIRALINEAYKTAIADLPLYTKALEATAGLDDSVRATEATRLVYGAERALREYNSDVYESCALLNSAGIDWEQLYSYYFTTKGLESDVDRKGNVVAGSKRAKVVSAINQLNLSTPQKLLLICAKGYSLQDGDIRGMTAKTAKQRLAKYICGLPLSAQEKAALAVKCGFKVSNGKILASSWQ